MRQHTCCLWFYGWTLKWKLKRQLLYYILGYFFSVFQRWGFFFQGTYSVYLSRKLLNGWIPRRNVDYTIVEWILYKKKCVAQNCIRVTTIANQTQLICWRVTMTCETSFEKMSLVRHSLIRRFNRGKPRVYRMDPYRGINNDVVMLGLC